MGIDPPSGNITFYSYESVADVDHFLNPKRLLNLPWISPY